MSTILHKPTLHPLIIGLDFVDVVQVGHDTVCVASWRDN